MQPKERIFVRIILMKEIEGKFERKQEIRIYESKVRRKKKKPRI